MDKTTSFKGKAFLIYFKSMEKLIKIKKKKRNKKHGFLSRMETHGGQKVLKRRRQTGRKKLTV